jgi:CheY-like chemotaxis protein
MNGIEIKSAVISTDSDVRVLLRQVIEDESEGSGLHIGLEIPVPFTEIDDARLEQLRQLNPEVIFLDLDDDPVMGLKFAQFLGEGAPGRKIIAVGPTLTPEQLLQAMQAGISEFLQKPLVSGPRPSFSPSSAPRGARVRRASRPT